MHICIYIHTHTCTHICCVRAIICTYAFVDYCAHTVIQIRMYANTRVQYTGRAIACMCATQIMRSPPLRPRCAGSTHVYSAVARSWACVLHTNPECHSVRQTSHTQGVCIICTHGHAEATRGAAGQLTA